jgi:hypothetical protein
MTGKTTIHAVITAVLMVSVLAGCSKQYSMRQDWNHLDYEKITKVPAKKS